MQNTTRKIPKFLQTAYKAIEKNLASGQYASSEPVYSMGSWSSNPPVPKKNCGPKPAQFIGTKKNPAFNEWKACSAAAAGGKRKTRRGKKSRRATRRRR